ncbi:MAG: hypothetical protein ACK6BG_05035 [Cyanobacteriota bacterium]
MLFNWRKRKGPSQQPQNPLSVNRESNSQTEFIFTWIITGKLAIGPMPRHEEDWDLLEKSGIKKRFSCCYPEEHIFAPVPRYWESSGVSLPDHRLQEELTPEKLVLALNQAITLLSKDESPMYLHCFAGQERSALLAIGIVSITENKDLFEGLAYIRQCYPRARPLYEHLDILERVLKAFK